MGDSGKGKSVLIGSLLGIKDHNLGDIIVNDKYKIKSLFNSKDKVSYVAQKVMIFDRSIEENVAYPKTELNGLDKKYIKTFNLEHLIGRETENKNVAKTLSGGEQRRISLIRGLKKKANVYVLDEPTNDLDNESVKILISELLKLKKNSIVIIISHDKRIIDISDKKIKI